MLINGFVATVLMIESVSDIKTKSISLKRLILYFVLALLANFIMKYQSIGSMFGGIMIGVLLILYGVVTRQGIGYGDGVMFICLGAVLGTYRNLKLLFFSLLIACCIGMIISFVKKNFSTQIPFMPCVLGTFIIMCILEVVI